MSEISRSNVSLSSTHQLSGSRSLESKASALTQAHSDQSSNVPFGPTSAVRLERIPSNNTSQDSDISRYSVAHNDKDPSTRIGSDFIQPVRMPMDEFDKIPYPTTFDYVKTKVMENCLQSRIGRSPKTMVTIELIVKTDTSWIIRLFCPSIISSQEHSILDFLMIEPRNIRRHPLLITERSVVLKVSTVINNEEEGSRDQYLTNREYEVLSQIRIPAPIVHLFGYMKFIDYDNKKNAIIWHVLILEDCFLGTLHQKFCDRRFSTKHVDNPGDVVLATSELKIPHEDHKYHKSIEHKSINQVSADPDHNQYGSKPIHDLPSPQVRLTLPLIRHLFSQVCRAIAACHLNPGLAILHGDVKPCNILLRPSATPILSPTGYIIPPYDCKLADFGLSVSSVEVGKHNLLPHRVGSRWYRAVELLLGSKVWSLSLDIWSLGCILGDMLIGQPLFPTSDDSLQLGCIFSILGSPTMMDSPTLWSIITNSGYNIHSLPRYPLRNGLPMIRSQMFLHATEQSLYPLTHEQIREYDNALDLMISMLSLEPMKRPTIEAVLAHPFLNVKHN